MIAIHRRKYRLLFLTLVLLVVGYPVLRTAVDTRIVLDVLITAAFVIMLFTVYNRGIIRNAAAALGIPTFVGLWIGYVLPGIPRFPLVIGFHLLATIFLGLTLATILRAVHREAQVSADAVFGTFCGYMMIGLAFGHLYCVVETIAPGSFRGSSDFDDRTTNETRLHQLLTYFSFITLTTVGYGDITPRNGAARGLAVAEAITGQFYIAVQVAELIGKRVSQALSPSPALVTNGEAK